MVLIKDVSIREFRGIRETAEPIPLSKFNVLVGKNNSGKTAVLEALSLFPVPFSAYHIPYTSYSRLDLISKMHSSADSLVYGYSGTSEIRFTLDNANIAYRINDHGQIFVRLNNEELSSEEYFKRIASLLGLELNSGYVERLNSLAVFVPNDTHFLNSMSGSIISAWNSIMKSGANVRIVRELISRVVHDRFTELFFWVLREN